MDVGQAIERHRRSAKDPPRLAQVARGLADGDQAVLKIIGKVVG